jgi:hypothetical protein
VSSRPQVAPDHVGQRRLVFYKQDPHGRIVQSGASGLH